MTSVSDGDEGQPGLHEAAMDSLNNETLKNTENHQTFEYWILNFHKNFEYLLVQQQEAMFKQ